MPNLRRLQLEFAVKLRLWFSCIEMKDCPLKVKARSLMIK